MKYWTAKKSKSIVTARRSELDLLFEFANVSILNEKNKFMQTQVLDCLSKHSALHPDNRNWKPDGDFFELMSSMQRHLHSRLSDIIENTKLLWEMPLWQISGSVQFKLNPIENRFQEHFKLRKVKNGHEIDALKKIMDLWLIEIIRDLDFTPRRFGQCLRCDAYFYNTTMKEKTYCSTRCSNAMRQDKFRKKGGK